MQNICGFIVSYSRMTKYNKHDSKNKYKLLWDQLNGFLKKVCTNPKIHISRKFSGVVRKCDKMIFEERNKSKTMKRVKYQTVWRDFIT